MNIKVVEHYNDSKKRKELLLVDFDYYDGMDYVSQKICDLYADKIITCFDGIYFIKTIGGRDLSGRGCFSATIRREPVYTMTHGEKIFERIYHLAEGRLVGFINKHFLIRRNKGILYGKRSYDNIWKKILSRKNNDKNVIFGCFCDWDNSPRKSYNSTIMTKVTAEKFKKYFSKLYVKAHNNNSPMVVINAWNEWGEGAYLEPDTKNGYGFLEAILETKKEFNCSGKQEKKA